MGFFWVEDINLPFQSLLSSTNIFKNVCIYTHYNFSHIIAVQIKQIRKVLRQLYKPDGLYANFLNPHTGTWCTSKCMYLHNIYLCVVVSKPVACWPLAGTHLVCRDYFPKSMCVCVYVSSLKTIIYIHVILYNQLNKLYTFKAILSMGMALWCQIVLQKLTYTQICNKTKVVLHKPFFHCRNNLFST